ncbi:MAG: hypothetical protein ABIR32_04480 [Ilumatobacteraceae bacterium]
MHLEVLRGIRIERASDSHHPWKAVHTGVEAEQVKFHGGPIGQSFATMYGLEILQHRCMSKVACVPPLTQKQTLTASRWFRELDEPIDIDPSKKEKVLLDMEDPIHAELVQVLPPSVDRLLQTSTRQFEVAEFATQHPRTLNEAVRQRSARCVNETNVIDGLWQCSQQRPDAEPEVRQPPRSDQQQCG